MGTGITGTGITNLIEFEQKRTLLYEYAEILAGVRQKFGKGVIGDCEDKEDLKLVALCREKRRENALYIIKFAFMHIYGIKTFEEALKHPEIWDLAQLGRIISGRYITIGSPCTSTPTEEKYHYINDKSAILYIIYNGYEKDMNRNLYQIYKYMSEHSTGVQAGQSRAELDYILKKAKERGYDLV